MSPTPSEHSSSELKMNHTDTAATTTAAPSVISHQGEKSLEDAHQVEHVHPLAQLGAARKNFLLFIFAVATFVDVCNVSGAAVAVAQIGADTGLGISQLVWIITSYSICFAAFLLFAGRLSDLFPASVIFELGFAMLGVASIVTSFVTTSKFGFLILRGIGGIFGALTIPSAYHLLVHMFPDPVIQQKKLAMLGLAGALGNVLGLLLAGVCMLANYRWFFRVVGIIAICFCAATLLLLPYTGSTYSQETNAAPRWKRMDVVGVVLMMGALITFILSLTQGPIDGWSSASFIAPFIIAFPLGVGFFFWESRIPPSAAVLPSSVWKITNMTVASIAVLFPFSFWATSQIQYSTYWQEVLHWSPIHVAVAVLPQGIVGLLIGGLVQAFPQIINKSRITIAVGAILIIAGEILQIYSDGGHGMNYWKYCFPGFLLGSAGAMLTFFASAINLISYCPPEMAGVAGAWTQVLAQVGGAVALAVQAGMQTNLVNWKESSGRAFWFMIAWVGVLALQYVIFYKTPGTPEEEHAAARRRIIESGKGEGVIEA